MVELIDITSENINPITQPPKCITERFQVHRFLDTIRSRIIQIEIAPTINTRWEEWLLTKLYIGGRAVSTSASKKWIRDGQPISQIYEEYLATEAEFFQKDRERVEYDTYSEEQKKTFWQLQARNHYTSQYHNEGEDIKKIPISFIRWEREPHIEQYIPDMLDILSQCEITYWEYGALTPEEICKKYFELDDISRTFLEARWLLRSPTLPEVQDEEHKEKRVVPEEIARKMGDMFYDTLSHILMMTAYTLKQQGKYNKRHYNGWVGTVIPDLELVAIDILAASRHIGLAWALCKDHLTERSYEMHTHSLPWIRNPRLAYGIAHLDYPVLVRFLSALAEKIENDGMKDLERSRPRLATELRVAARYIDHSREVIEQVISRE
jgi:hypothetical protein